jgi:hypothetical protein
MDTQHNPIAQRINEMQDVWQQKVLPHHALVRWWLKPTDARMYEGFCRLEATEHGGLEDSFVFFYTPFEDENSYSSDILKDWLQELNPPAEKRQQLIAQGIPLNKIDVAGYQASVDDEDTDTDQLLLSLLSIYAKLIGPKTTLVLALLPKSMASIGGFARWLQTIMEKPLPPKVRLLVLDHDTDNYWGELFGNFNDRSVTLDHDLRMDEAIKELATGGNASDPQVQYRKCLFEMGAAVQNNNLPRLHEWGKKALDSSTQSGDKTLLATAYITYAGMLFHFKEQTATHDLLDKGMNVCQQQVAAGDMAAVPLLLQFYGYKAAIYQHQKDTKQALEWFMRQGHFAKKHELNIQAVSAYSKAFVLANHQGSDRATEAIEAAILLTPVLKKEEVQTSEYPYLAYDYLYRAKHGVLRSSDEKISAVETLMQESYGKSWRKTVEEWKQNQDRRWVEQTAAAAMV